MSNNTEFKVVDANTNMLSVLFEGGETTPTPQEPNVTATPPTTSVVQSEAKPVQTETTDVQTTKQPTLARHEMITNDDLLGIIGITGEESEKPKTEVPKTEPVTTEEPKNTNTNTIPEGLNDDDIKLRNKLYTQHLINKGVWSEFEGVDIDEIDFSVENFEKIVEIQNNLQSQTQVSSRWDEVKKSHKIIESVLEIVENDGDPTEILKLYGQQEALTKSLKFDSLDDNLDAIRKFYTEKATPRWSVEKANRYIKNLEIDGDEAIKAEGKYVQEQYGEVFEEERKAKIAQVAAEAQAKEEKRKAEIRTNYDSLQKQGFNPKDAQKLLRDVYEPKYKQGDSNTVLTELDVKLLKIKEDPEAYMDYVQFVLDRDGYKKALSTKTANEVTTNVWSQLKSGEKKTSENVSITSKTAKGDNNIYEQLLKNKN